MPLRPGDSVEHFTIVSFLGKGGMGEVYVALDTRLRRHVALKIVHPGSAESGSDRGSDGSTRLMREAQSAASLTHPNVVTIYEVGEIRADGDQQGFTFIAMELVKGKTLRAYVGDPSIPFATRVAWLADIARALAAAHRARLIHRDVKPDNVMVSSEGIVKVLDFGLARRAPPNKLLSSRPSPQTRRASLPPSPTNPSPLVPQTRENSPQRGARPSAAQEA